MSALPPVLLFDLDDTILDLSNTARQLWAGMCRRFAPGLRPGTDPEALFAAVREAGDRFWHDAESRRWGIFDLDRARRVIVAEAFSRTGAGSGTAAFEFADTFSRERIDSIEPFPGAIPTLESLRRRGVRLGLVTNGKSKTQREKIERFDLAQHFDVIAVEEEFGVGKPDVRVFRFALSHLGAGAADAWMVGDNLETDVAGAQGAGIHAIWNDFAGRGLPGEPPARPDRIIRAITDLLVD